MGGDDLENLILEAHGAGPSTSSPRPRAMLALADLRAANETRQREWDPQSRVTLEYRGNELAGETGEACNVIKKLARERNGMPGSRATVQQLADELADVVICADLVAMAEGIDLGAAVVAKFNATSEKVGLATRLRTSVPVPVMSLPAQMEELRGKLAIFRHWFEHLSGMTPERAQAAIEHLDACLRLVPVPHDDAQGGRPVVEPAP